MNRMSETTKQKNPFYLVYYGDESGSSTKKLFRSKEKAEQYALEQNIKFWTNLSPMEFGYEEGEFILPNWKEITFQDDLQNMELVNHIMEEVEDSFIEEMNAKGGFHKWFEKLTAEQKARFINNALTFDIFFVQEVYTEEDNE